MAKNKEIYSTIDENGLTYYGGGRIYNENGNLETGKNLIVAGAGAITGNATIGGTLTVTGALTFSGLLNADGGIAVDTTGFTVNGTTYAIAAIPTATTGDAVTLDFSTLTTGNGLKVIGVDGTLNGGKYLNCYGGTGTTSVFAIGEGGIVTLKGGALLDNATDAAVLNLTETTVRVTGILDITGGLTTDTNAFAIADTTGVLTMKNGATLDNNADAAILNLTETTVRISGILDVTGNATLVSTDIGGGYVAGTGGSGATIAATGAISVNGAGVIEQGLTIGVNGATGQSGNLVINNGANPGQAVLTVASATGIMTMYGGATIDNNADAAVLNLTETTVRVTGALDVTGGLTTDTNAFAIADTTGVVTMLNGATLDNNADAAVLNITETTVRITGILDVTGNSTLASADIGGGFVTGTGSGLTVAATGALSTNGAIISESTLTSGNNGANGHAGGLTINNGANPGAASLSIAGATGIITMAGGATLDNNTDAAILNLTETTVRVTGILDVTGNSTLVSADIGGGYTAGTGTGATIATTGAISANGALQVDSTIASGVNGASGIVGGITVRNGANPGQTSWAVAGATGIVTMFGGATLDNNADANVLNISETTVRVTGALDVTGGFTTDTNAFAVADTTGVLTLKNGATIDNNADTAVLNLTETTIRASGILDVTGNSTLASADIGGGYTAGTAGSGATITALGAISANAAGTFETGLTLGVNGATGQTGSFTINNGANPGAASFSIAGATGVVTMAGGATLDNNADAAVLNLTETTVRVSGILDVTGNSTLVSLDVGGGYGSTGATISAAGVGTFNGALTTDGALTAASLTVGGTAVTATSAQMNSLLRYPGTNAFATLRVASNVISAETVTIGADVYEVEIVNTDTTDNTAGGSFNNTTDPLTVVGAVTSYVNCTFAVGKLFRIENEILRVTGVAGNDVTFARGVSGTTTAAHADPSDIYAGDGIAGGSTIAVGLVATLTPTAFTPALVDDINTAGTEAATAVQISVNEMLLYADAVGVTTTAVAEGLTGANNAWDTGNLRGGTAAALKRVASVSRVPNTQDVAIGNLHIVLGWQPATVQVQVVTTATGATVAWDGDILPQTWGAIINNDGATDWAEATTVYIHAVE